MDPMLSMWARVVIMVAAFVAWLVALGVIAVLEHRSKPRSTPNRFDAQATPVPSANAASHLSSMKKAA